MRPILIRLLLDRPWLPWDGNVEGVPGVGVGFALLVLAGLAAIYLTRTKNWKRDGATFFLTLVGGLILIAVLSSQVNGRIARETLAPDRPSPTLPSPQETVRGEETPPKSFADSLPNSVPVFGYGVLVLTGFLAGTWLGQRRAIQEGIDPEIVFDATFWTLVSGVIGARLFHVVQYHDLVFSNAESPGELLFAAINLSQGGLVLIGGMLGGAVGYFVVCHRRRISPMVLVDVLTPSIFVGVGFGRIGCLLFSCCYGDPTSLPWGIQFPPDSVAFDAYVHRGLVAPDAPTCIPLHPTQIYSAINGFLLAAVTLAYFPYRRHAGQVFALGMILYAITRFTIEIVRSDEAGQFGTGLTISQLLCIALLATGLLLARHLGKKPSTMSVK